VSQAEESASTNMAKTTATKMATAARIDPKVFREVLHDENFDWHRLNDRWTVEVGSEEHCAMQRVLNKFTR
jgi:hypothetical protein